MLASCQDYMKLSTAKSKVNNLSKIPEEAQSIEIESVVNGAKQSIYHAKSPTGSQTSGQSHSKYVD